MSAERLQGTWTLETWRAVYDSGRVIYPMGEDAEGWLLYTAGGYMAAFLARAGRASFTTGEALTADDAEKIAAWDSFFAYSGTYEVVGSTVRHHIDACQYPNWIGDVQVREMVFEDGRLILKTPPQKTGRGTQHSEVIWRRAASPPGG